MGCACLKAQHCLSQKGKCKNVKKKEKKKHGRKLVHLNRTLAALCQTHIIWYCLVIWQECIQINMHLCKTFKTKFYNSLPLEGCSWFVPLLLRNWMVSWVSHTKLELQNVLLQIHPVWDRQHNIIQSTTHLALELLLEYTTGFEIGWLWMEILAEINWIIQTKSILRNCLFFYIYTVYCRDVHLCIENSSILKFNTSKHTFTKIR